MEIERIGVVGCGTMGAGIARLAAVHGYPTIVQDVSPAALDKGLEGIRSGLERSVARGRMEEAHRAETLSRLRGTLILEELRDSDLVIEAIFEDKEEKRRLFAALGAICSPSTILASNTSALAVTELALASGRPQRVVGMHFFNPPTAMELVEVIKTAYSEESIVEAVASFARSLGKTVVVVGDSPGFIVNRLLIPYLLDAVRALESGLGNAEDIDAAMRLGAQHPMGPFSLIDLIGVDVIFNVAQSLHQALGEARFLPPPSLVSMLQKGHLGQKTGRGFYEYR